MEIRGTNFNVQISGEGTPFIWAHELLGSVDEEDGNNSFKFNSYPQNIKLIRYDARGHGKSQTPNKPEDYHFESLGKDMLAIAEAVGAKQFIAGGMSLGAATSLHAALQAPERLKAIVLVAPGTAWETRARQRRIYNLIAIVGLLLGSKSLIRLRGRSAPQPPKWLAEAEPNTIAGIGQRLSELSRKSTWNLFRGIADSDLPPRERIKELVNIPAIILAWVDDPTHPASTANELHQLLPQSELFIAQGYEEFMTIPQQLREFVLKHA